jgi:type I restriction enzyme S subunit
MRPYLRVANVYDARIDLSDVLEMNFTPEEYETFRLEPGDVLLNEGQSLEWVGRAAIYRGAPRGACFQNTLIRFRAGPRVLPEFALLVFRHYVYSQRFRRIARWTTNIAHLGSDRFADVEFPVPPLAEQKRIVAAADEHFTRLDAGVAALERLQSHLRRYRGAVLAATFPSGDLPRGWKSIPVEEAMTIIDYRGRTPPYAPSGIPHLRSSNIKRGAILWEDVRYVTEETYAKYMTRGIPAVGDVLLTTEAPLGEVALVPPQRFSLAQRMMVLRPARTIVTAVFLKYQLMSGRFQALLRRSSTGSTVTGISSRNFRALAVPVPPLDVQARIVSEIEGKLSIADAVEAQAAFALRRGFRLRIALIRAAFEGRLVAPEKPARAPAA